MALTNFAEVHAALRPLYDNTRTKYDLNVMRALMEFLGNPQDSLRVVHVAGTSGKTSTAYYIAAFLQAGDARVGLTVSPHVDEINERVQINGNPLDESTFCRELTAFMELVRQSKLQPSYFEVMVAFAYWEFAKQNVDYAVVEVGLGGLLDGTNVVSRKDKICVITDIGLDHTEILGDTLEKITQQKAGIIQPGNHVFLYEQGKPVTQAMQEYADKQSATLHIFPNTIAVRGGQLPLFQQRNLGLAVQVTNFVRNRDGQSAVSKEAVVQAAGITIPARMERFMLDGKTLIVDGSHNGQKISSLRESISALYPDQKIAALIAFVEGPDNRWQGGLDEVIRIANKVIVTSFRAEQDVPRASIDPERVSDYLKSQNFQNVTIQSDPAWALQTLLESSEQLLLVVGSFYLLNHIRPLIVKR